LAGEGFFAAVDLDGVAVEFDSGAGEYELAGFADEEGFGAVSFATGRVGERGNGAAASSRPIKPSLSPCDTSLVAWTEPQTRFGVSSACQSRASMS